MSVMKCTSCGKDEDTDKRLGLSVLGKYYYCDDCICKDEVFEVLDELQTALDKQTRMFVGMTRAVYNANAELKTLFDASKQALDSCGIPRD